MLATYVFPKLSSLNSEKVATAHLRLQNRPAR